MHSSRRFAGGLQRNRAPVLRAAVARFAASVSSLAFLLAAPAIEAAGQVTITDATNAPVKSAATSPQPQPTTATPAPGLTQPPSLTPRSSPYPTTRFPAHNGLIQQPQFVAPDRAAASGSGDKSSAAFQSATAPPKLASQLAQPRPFTPPQKQLAPTTAAATPPPANPPKKSSRFWEFITGRSQPSSTTKVTAATSAPPAAVPATNTPAQASGGFGGSLVAQLLGTNSPPPQTVRRNASTTTSEPAQSTSSTQNMLLASADEELAAEPTLPSGPRPTLRDIEEAKTPAASMTITRPGWMQQLGLRSTPVAPPPQQSAATMPAGTLPVPTVPNRGFESTASALWGPVTMTNDAPTAPMPEASRSVEAASLPESETVPDLLRPFYATNPPARGSAPTASSAQTATASSAAPESFSEMFVQSSLGRQLTLANTEDLRTPMTAAIEAQVKHDQQPWDGRVTVQWPLMTNPFTMTDSPEPPGVVGSAAVAQVAFLQEPQALPEPGSAPSSGIGLPGVDDDREGDDEPNAAGDENKDEAKTLAGARSIGTAPEDNTLDFLRTQTVLLAPGKHQFDIGLEYTLTENSFPILRDAGGGQVFVDEVEFKGRELAVPMELRMGLLRRLQGFIQVPVGWANVQAAANDFDEFESDGGVGDVGFGLTAQLRDAYKDCPYIIGTVAGLAPVGGDPFGVVGVFTPSAPSLGNGFWAVSGNLLWVQPRYDPVVIFYGFGARYQFEREFLGIEFAPGTEYNYTLGAGFAVNERVTLSTQFFGAYVEEIKANGERVEGTIQEPMNIRLAATLAKPCNRLVEPFVMFGLTDDSISSNFGITWTY